MPAGQCVSGRCQQLHNTATHQLAAAPIGHGRWPPPFSRRIAALPIYDASVMTRSRDDYQKCMHFYAAFNMTRPSVAHIVGRWLEYIIFLTIHNISRVLYEKFISGNSGRSAIIFYEQRHSLYAISAPATSPVTAQAHAPLGYSSSALHGHDIITKKTILHIEPRIIERE